MLELPGYCARHGNPQSLILVVFGILAARLGSQDFKARRQPQATGKTRIAGLLTNRLGASIAAIPAALVINVSFEPR